MIALIAVNNNGIYSCDGKMPWHCPEDLKLFKKTTINSKVIMGGETWRSLPTKPLPQRTNIVLSKSPASNFPDEVVVVDNIHDLKKYAVGGSCYSVGGANFIEMLLKQNMLSEIRVSRINDWHQCQKCKVFQGIRKYREKVPTTFISKNLSYEHIYLG